MSRVIDTASGQVVKVQTESRQKFDATFENNFLVLPDGKTVIGPDAQNEDKLVMEDITTKEVSEIGKHGKFIYTVLYHEESRSLLVGDHTGHVVQYQKKEDSNSFTKVKDYGDVGIKMYTLLVKSVITQYLGDRELLPLL